MEIIDRKYKITAVSLNSGKTYTEKHALLFKLSDALLPDLIDKYLELCHRNGVDVLQIEGLELLKERVLKWQRANIKLVKMPGVDPGKEEKRICKPNKRKEDSMW